MSMPAQNIVHSVPTDEMARLYSSGFSLLPLGGGADGKAPLRKFSKAERIALKQVLGPMHRKSSACYGVRLDRLAVIDCDKNCQELVRQMEARFGASPVHVATPRGVHLYYSHDHEKAPNLREEGLPVDIKRGASSYVVGPCSVRTDGGIYLPKKGMLGVDRLPRLATTQAKLSNNSAVITKGNRNHEMTLTAIKMVEAVDSPEELFGNLAFIRDNECEDPTTFPDRELRKIAEWAWSKRLEGNVYGDRNSEVRINRQVLDALANFKNADDALALYVVIQANHGHIIGKTFVLKHSAMVPSKHTSMGRRRFQAAVTTLLAAGVLGVAKEYAVGKSCRSYRLLRIRPDLPDVHSMFVAQDSS
jgi:hypothetical protein